MKKETIRFLKKIFGNNDFIRFMEWEGKLTKDALMQELAISELERELLYKTLTRIQDEVKKLKDYGYIDEMLSKESEHYEQDHFLENTHFFHFEGLYKTSFGP